MKFVKLFFILIFLNFNTLSSKEFIIVQSTTSTRDSGFYDYLLPKFTEKYGFDIRVVAVGTGQALKNAHSTTGRAIFYTATTISAGFCILILSNFFPTLLFGLFTSIAMILAFISSLTLLPNLLVKYRVFQ